MSIAFRPSTLFCLHYLLIIQQIAVIKTRTIVGLQSLKIIRHQHTGNYDSREPPPPNPTTPRMSRMGVRETHVVRFDNKRNVRMPLWVICLPFCGEDVRKRKLQFERALLIREFPNIWLMCSVYIKITCAWQTAVSLARTTDLLKSLLSDKPGSE